MSWAGFIAAALHSETLTPLSVVEDPDGSLWAIPAAVDLTCRCFQGPAPVGGPARGETWRHKKGALYRAVGVARHVVSGEEFVIYGRDGEGLWARPRAMFEDGRFTRIDPPRLRMQRLAWSEPLLITTRSHRVEAQGADGRAYRLLSRDEGKTWLAWRDGNTPLGVHLGALPLEEAKPLAQLDYDEWAEPIIGALEMCPAGLIPA